MYTWLDKCCSLVSVWKECQGHQRVYMYRHPIKANQRRYYNKHVHMVLILERVCFLNKRNVLLSPFSHSYTFKRAWAVECRIATTRRCLINALGFNCIQYKHVLYCRLGVVLDGWMHPLDEQVYDNIQQPVLMINMESFQWKKNVEQMMRLMSEEDREKRNMITIK